MVPGVNAAWRVGEEGFMKRLGWFEDLKVRASYGEMGNQSGIGLYDYIQLISFIERLLSFRDWRERTNGYDLEILFLPLVHGRRSRQPMWDLISRRSITVYMDRSTTSGKRIRTCLSRRPILLC